MTKLTNLDAAVAAIIDAGFVPDGATMQEHVRIPTTRSPVFGGIGGEARTVGGRTRYALPDTDVRVTVGKVTTFFYRTGVKRQRPGDMGTQELYRCRTKDLVAIQAALRTIVGPA